MKKYLLIPFFFFFLNQINQATELKPEFSIRSGFVQNKGQILDQAGKKNTHVLFVHFGKQMNIHLRKNGFSYEQMGSKKSHRIDIQFKGANPLCEIVASNEVSGTFSYSSTTDIQNRILAKQYQAVVYKEIYPGIDLEFLLEKETIKYNVVVHPGADLNLVQFEIKGSKKIKISKAGSLLLRTCFGNLTEKIPVSYEQNESGSRGKLVEVKFRKIGKNLVGFHATNYDKSKTLVVDPLAWGTYFGGSVTEYPSGIATDAVGNSYFTGRTNSGTNIATTGAYQTVFGGGLKFDTYLAKFSPSGSLIWATYFGAATMIW